jgi:two-component system, response regulator
MMTGSVLSSGGGSMNRHNVILLVEDQAGDVELALRAARKSNPRNEVVVASDGVEALDYLLGAGRYAGQEPKAAPDLILLDLGLPRVGGLAVLRRLRAEERTRHIPVVVLTGTREERVVVSSHDLGANRFVVKPLDVAKFAAAALELGLYGLIADMSPEEQGGKVGGGAKAKDRPLPE